jgi:hypothetical protein
MRIFITLFPGLVFSALTSLSLPVIAQRPGNAEGAPRDGARAETRPAATIAGDRPLRPGIPLFQQPAPGRRQRWTRTRTGFGGHRKMDQGRVKDLPATTQL